MNQFFHPYVVAVVLAGCGANGAIDTPCELSCGSRTVGGGLIKVEPLVSNEIKYSCDVQTKTENDQTFYSNELGEFTAKFLVYEDLSGGTSSSTTSTTPSTTTSSAGAAAAKRVPKARVSFNPNIILPVNKDDKANQNTATPQSEWCTDTCGYATVKVRPVCVHGSYLINITVPGSTGEAGNTSNGGSGKEITVTMSKPQ